MPDEPNDRLAQLLDREAIRDCLYRYCRGIDRADEQALRSAYWHDAMDHHGAYSGPASGFIDKALPNLRVGRGVHLIGNILIELNVDVAAVESYFVAWQQEKSKGSNEGGNSGGSNDSNDSNGSNGGNGGNGGHHVTRETLLCGRYVDRFERRNGEWRVADRTVVYDWIRQTPLPAPLDEAAFGKRKPVGGKAPDDPIYALLATLRDRPPESGTR